MYPISDLTAYCRRTTGDVPPRLVGTSTTVVGSKMYLYGGRLVSERKMVSDIYVFDMETYRWERLFQSSEDDVPQARYFHSADSWNNHLVIFGGMAIQPQSDNPEDLCVLNDVRLFDLSTYRWLPVVENAPTAPIPKARYAHLSSITSNRLFIIGGQDLNNVWLDDVHVYDLVSGAWVQRRDYPRHCGTYRSVAVTGTTRVRLPQEEGRQSSQLGTPGTRFNADKNTAPTPDVTQSDTLLHLPYSAEPTDEYPCDIFLFSNYNFTDVQRELEVISPLPGFDFTVSDRSASMTGTFFPPGLRFPTGAILGTHFIIAGTYLSQTFQSFSIWALDLVSMTWSRVDPGSTLSSTSGSWFRSCLWPEANKFLVFGNKHGNLVEDYNRRLLSWDHVIYIDLEAFGIYQPPTLALDLPQQELGLAALEEGILADFEIICDDGRKIKCSRKLLEDRWPWFKEQRRIFVQAASRALEAIPAIGPQSPTVDVRAASDKDEPRPDPRLTPRAFNLSEPYPITLAFLQYLYSMSLITPLQHAPAVLSQLLLLSSTYEMGHLQSLVKHAMHRALTFATSVGIYGVSTLCNCRSLQIRALRVVMAYSQKRPSAGRPRQDRDGSGGGRNHDSTNGEPGGHADKRSAARPRGMSDASYMRGSGAADGGSSASTGRGYANAPEDHRSVPSESNVASITQISTAGGGITTRISDRGFTSRINEFAATPSSSKPLHRRSNASPNVQHQKVATLPSSRIPEPSSSLATHQRVEIKSRPTILSATAEDDILALADILSVDTTDDEVADHSGRRKARRSGSRSRPPSSSHSDHRSSASSRRLHTSAAASDDDLGNNKLALPSPTELANYLNILQSRPKYLSDTPSMTTSSSLTNSDTFSSPTLSTPALSRSSSFQLISPPVSPYTQTFLPSPVDSPFAGYGLGVIHESQHSDDAGPVDKTWVYLNDEESMGIEEVQRELSQSHLSWNRQNASPLESRTSDSDTIRPSITSGSSTQSSDDLASRSSPMHSSPKAGPLHRLFKTSRAGRGDVSDSPSPYNAKAAKEEEKRRQKQLVKERRDRLAREFQAKADGQASPSDGQSMSSDEIRRRKATIAWEESNGLWSGPSAWAH
ncbi:galactose oxidase [Trametopsis cervina]|nr:galactose oxidase [Trametopsis cervina]